MFRIANIIAAACSAALPTIGSKIVPIKRIGDVELRRRSLDGVGKDIGQKCDENDDNAEPCYAAPETKHGRILVLQFAMPLDEI